MSVTVDPPAKLPVDRLSVSSIRLLHYCPEKWMRRYIMREYEPPSGKMILGSSIGAAEAQHYSHVIESGEGFTLEQVQDEFASEWDDRLSREEIVWGSDDPGQLKDQGVAVLGQYHSQVAAHVQPVSVEREFLLGWEGVDWKVVGYLDLELSEPDPFFPERSLSVVADLKVKGKRISAVEADADWQASLYLLARRAEGNPADGFQFHTMVRAKSPKVEVVPTRRSEVQLDSTVDRVFAAASEIAWRAENEVWSGASEGHWLCSQRMCGYWSQCRFGGLK